jgi:hypothetical protein
VLSDVFIIDPDQLHLGSEKHIVGESSYCTVYKGNCFLSYCNKPALWFGKPVAVKQWKIVTSVTDFKKDCAFLR